MQIQCGMVGAKGPNVDRDRVTFIKLCVVYEIGIDFHNLRVEK